MSRRSLLSSLGGGLLAGHLPACAGAPAAATSPALLQREHRLGIAASNPFPSGFTWGAASSAYQIEGAASEDARGPSVWDVFCKRPGDIIRSNGARALAATTIAADDVVP